jgi:hypothetical protein
MQNLQRETESRHRIRSIWFALELFPGQSQISYFLVLGKERKREIGFTTATATMEVSS